MNKHYLTPLFSPQTIALFAGSSAPAGEQSRLGMLVARHLAEGGFAGVVTYLDIGTSGTLGELAQSRNDLAIIALPAEQVAAALDVAGRIQCKAALIVSSGIDTGLAARLQAIARQHGMFLLGPNSMGFQRCRQSLNASALGPLASAGNLALVSQSGALTSSILNWAGQNGVGFSSVVSLGPNTAVDVAQVLDFLAEDADTHSIVVCLEGIRNARHFMSALRGAAISKPVIVLKAGRKPAGAKAALTHSGAIVGSDEVFDAALRRAGAVRVDSFVQLFSAAKCLASRYRPAGKRLAVVSNGGGPGVLAVDRISERKLELASLSAQAIAELTSQVSPEATLDGVIDLGEDADAAHYRAVIGACAGAACDGMLVILSPKPGIDATAIAQVLAEMQPTLGKPLITCWMGGDLVAEGRVILNNAAIPTFRTPEAAVDAFGNIAAFHENQQLLLQTPPPLSPLPKPDLEGARLLIENVLAERREILTEMESKALLAAFHVPVTRTILARSANEAILIASQLGYPVALKIDSPDIPHKSDVQGVVLNVGNAVTVRDTWQDMMANVARLRPDARINGVTVQNMAGKPKGRELYIGVTTDALFGPVIAFGAGGTMIELIADRAVELPPLNQFIARRLIGRVRSAVVLDAWRGAPAVDRDALEHMLLRVSEMVCALPQLCEMDINPVIADADGALAVDARIVIGHAPAGIGNDRRLAILPYPSWHDTEWPLPGGGRYISRAIHPNDADMLQAFARALSPESRYFRFASSLRELSPRMLARFTLIDYDREMALVAVYAERRTEAEGGGADSIIGVARYITNADRSSCEFSLAVADAFAGQGVGSRLLLSIMEVARSKGLATIEGLVLANNSTMLRLMRSLGFTVERYADDPDFKLCSKPL
ncbi:MAG: bifunctional acetate--CoA ligase family protein/GNAT family N-acetyltransferase [Herminiimonas sp.]|nr:bifunctional acetate--CoA ligase family protein/GNAT family N-acetyltransferase [Herminiimonas sp.]